MGRSSVEDLVEIARSVIRNSYSPYSRFRVASVVRTGDGRVFHGVNVENASYGLTVCAERVAIFTAVANGARSIREILVATETDEPVPPCGACLQVLSEFATSDTKVYMVSLTSGRVVEKTLSELMPHRFTRKELEQKMRES